MKPKKKPDPAHNMSEMICDPDAACILAENKVGV